MLVRCLIILLFFLPGKEPLRAQSSLDLYVQEAMANNLVVKEKHISLQKSVLALKEARSLFLPSSNMEGNYTLANGGRAIDIPVGDLMNPVYQTLNQLTASNRFPEVKNVSEQLNPNNFYDLRIRTSMPVLNADLKSNSRIREQEITLKEKELVIYKRELIREVKQSYFNYLMTGKEIAIYQNALIVVHQNLKVNRSLLANGKGLPAYVSRAESEVQQVESQLQNAKNNQENARAYFNFLLNKSLESDIIVTDTLQETTLRALITNLDPNIASREELKSLSVAKQISQEVLKSKQAFWKPRVNIFLDLGAQGFDFKVNNNSFFYLGGIQVQMPIFAGKRNLYKTNQAELDLKNLELETVRVSNQLELSKMVSRNNVLTAYSSFQSALKQEEAAVRYFRLIDRGYQEGINSFIEFLDARNQFTRTQLQTNLNRFKLLSALADFERQTASFSFN